MFEPNTPPRALNRPVGLDSFRPATFLAAFAFALACAVGLPGFGGGFGPEARAAFAEPVQVTLSVPTEVPCAVLADGTVVGPSSWSVSSPVDAPANLSGVSVSGAPDGVSFSTVKGDGSAAFSYSDGAATLSGGLAVPARGSASLSWSFSQLDAAKNSDLLAAAADGAAQLCAVSLTFSAEPVAFAVYSDDDKSLRFYKRTVVPSAGSTFEGRTVTEVYTGIEDGEYQRQWDDIAADVDVVEFEEPVAPIRTDSWFKGFSKISSFSIGAADMSRCINMSAMLSHCDSLVSVDMSGANLAEAKYLNHLCTHDPALSSISLPDDIPNCTTIAWMLEDCSALTSLDLSRTNFGKIQQIEGLLESAYKLEYADLSSLDLTSCQNGQCSPFACCLSLRALKVGDGWRWMEKSDDGSKDGIILPDPNAVAGYDGRWYAASDGTAYAAGSTAPNKADTYYSVAPSAFAVYSDTDKSLEFYNRAGRPNAGDVWQGKTATEVYTGFENSRYTSDTEGSSEQGSTAPWNSIKENVFSVSAMDAGIKPKNLYLWFQNFKNCRSIDLSKFDMSACTDLSHAFTYCVSLTNLNVSGWDLSNNMEFNSAFRDLRSLETLDLSSVNWAPYLSLHIAFTNDGKLKTLNLGSSFEVKKVQYAYGTFWGCKNLSLDCTNWTVNPEGNHELFNSGAPGVTLPLAWQPAAFAVYSDDNKSLDFYKRERWQMPSAGDTFNGKAATSVYTGFEDATYSATAGASNDKAQTDATVNTPWFEHASEIESVSVFDPDIKPANMAFWFQNLTACKTFNVSKLNVSRVQSLNNTFANCSSATFIDVSGWDVSHVANLVHTFIRCSSLPSLDLSTWSTPSLKDLHNTFGGDLSLETLKLGSGWDTSHVVRFCRTFQSCTKLVLDCSSWSTASIPTAKLTDANNPYANSYFNDKAPGVTPPNWPALEDDATNEEVANDIANTATSDAVLTENETAAGVCDTSANASGSEYSEEDESGSNEASSQLGAEESEEDGNASADAPALPAVASASSAKEEEFAGRVA